MGKDVYLRLPEGKTHKDIKWISIWGRRDASNYGHVMIPEELIIPTPVEIKPLTGLKHDLSSGPITIVDAQTFLIPDFHYDGLGPAAHWWATRGPEPSASGTKLMDENGGDAPLKQYTGQAVVISLPEGKTIYDYDFLSVWCEKFFANFGHTRIPQDVLVPPSPRMLGIKPEVSLLHFSFVSPSDTAE